MNKLVVNKYSIEKLLPFYCACVTYKTVYNYFIYLVPALESVWSLLYNMVTLFGLVMFIPLAFFTFLRINRYKRLWPALIIPLCVIINIVAVMFETGDITILSRDHFISFAEPLNHYGFYFAQINTWFGNMTVVLMITLFASKKETLKKCVLSSIFMLFLPAILTVATHPELLGMRASTVEGSDVVFSGGPWNIGVMGIGSISWLVLALTKYMTKKQKCFAIIAVATFAILGIAGLSRTLLAMMALSGCVYFLLAKKDASLFTKVILIFIAVSVFIMLQTDLVEMLLGRFNNDASGTQNIRVSLWKAYIAHYKEVWLFGAPYGSVYNYYYDLSMFGLHFMPHSSIVNFFVRFGIFAALAYLALIKNAFLSFRIGETLSRNQFACIIAGCVSYVSLAFINQTGYAEPIFYIMFGLFLAYSQILKKEESEIQYENRDRNEDR